MFTFEILQGDVFDCQGAYLTVTQVRVSKVGDEVRVYVRYVLNDQIKNRPVDEVVAMLSEGMEKGTVSNLNRPADFGLF